MQDFTLAQAMAAQRRLRQELGLGEERFPLPAFVGMVSDEIEQLRDAGHDDRAIAGLIGDATGHPITAKEIAQHYAPPEARGHG